MALTAPVASYIRAPRIVTRDANSGGYPAGAAGENKKRYNNIRVRSDVFQPSEAGDRSRRVTRSRILPGFGDHVLKAQD